MNKKISWKGKLSSRARPTTPPTIKVEDIKIRSPGVYYPKGDEDLSFGDAHGDHEGFKGHNHKPRIVPSMKDFATASKSKGGRRTRKKTRKTRKTRRKRRLKKKSKNSKKKSIRAKRRS